MPRISEARQASDVRVSRLATLLYDAIAAFTQTEPELTVEEVLVAVVRVADRQAQVLRGGQ